MAGRASGGVRGHAVAEGIRRARGGDSSGEEERRRGQRQEAQARVGAGALRTRLRALP